MQDKQQYLAAGRAAATADAHTKLVTFLHFHLTHNTCVINMTCVDMTMATRREVGTL
jgi:hypothetical protein